MPPTKRSPALPSNQVCDPNANIPNDYQTHKEGNNCTERDIPRALFTICTTTVRSTDTLTTVRTTVAIVEAGHIANDWVRYKSSRSQVSTLLFVFLNSKREREQAQGIQQNFHSVVKVRNVLCEKRLQRNP